jgi:hypothetical protein
LTKRAGFIGWEEYLSLPPFITEFKNKVPLVEQDGE